MHTRVRISLRDVTLSANLCQNKRIHVLLFHYFRAHFSGDSSAPLEKDVTACTKKMRHTYDTATLHFFYSNSSTL